MKQWSYRRKNKSLIVLSVICLILSWFLAFKKTVTLISNNNKLEYTLNKETLNHNASTNLKEKVILQDSLIFKYSADSTEWTTNLLGNVGSKLIAIPVGITYTNIQAGKSKHTIDREVIFEGTIDQLQEALKRIEQEFYVKFLNYYWEEGKLKSKIILSVIKH